MQVLILLILLVFGCHAAIVQSPVNTVSHLGSEITLSCSTSSAFATVTASWSRNSQFITNLKEVNDQYQGKYSLSHDISGKYDLVIHGLELSDAGHYTCMDTYDNGEASAELIIFDGESLCRANITDVGEPIPESEVIEFTCEVKFNGSWAPSIVWYRYSLGGATNLLTDSTTWTNTSDNRRKTMTSRLLTTVNSEMNGHSLGITVHFDISKKPMKTSASNIPSYNRSSTCLNNINVAYGPRQIPAIENMKAVSSSSEETTFTCTSNDVNPAPKYSWKTTDKTLGSEQKLDGCDVQDSLSSDIQCAVTNPSTGRQQFASFKLSDHMREELVGKCDRRHQEMVVVITVVCIGVVVVIGAFTVVFIILRQPGCSDRSRRNAIPDLVNGHAAPLPAPVAQRQATPSGRRVVPGAAPPPPAHQATLPVLPTAPPPPVAAAVTAAQSMRDVNANMTNSPRTNAQRDTHSNGGTGINYVTVVGSNHVSDASDGGSSDDDDEDRVDVTQFYMHKDYINLNEAYRPAQAERAAAIASAAGIQPPEDPNYNSDGPIYTSVSSTTSSTAASPRLVAPREQPQYAAIDHSCLQAANALQTASQSLPPAAPSSTITAVDKK